MQDTKASNRDPCHASSNYLLRVPLSSLFIAHAAPNLTFFQLFTGLTAGAGNVLENASRTTHSLSPALLTCNQLGRVGHCLCVIAGQPVCIPG